MLFCIRNDVIGIAGAEGFHIRESDIDLRFRRPLGHRRDGSVLLELIFKEADPFFESCFELRIGKLGAIGVVRQIAGVIGLGEDINVITDDGISFAFGLLAHVNLRIGSIAHIPRPNGRLGRGVDGHIAGGLSIFAAGIDGAPIDCNSCHAHGAAGRRDLDSPAVLAIGARIDIGFLDRNHAAMLRILRVGLHV